MARRHASIAEYYRAHGRAFRLALELGCTPAEAEAEIAKREARERWDAAERRLRAAMNGPLPTSAQRPAWNAPWMMQE